MTTTSEAGTASQPESLDLDYDDWEGQFEFVGPNVIGSTQRNGGGGATSDDDDELNFNLYSPNGNRPVLVDEETFLSLHPNDFDDDDDDDGDALSLSGPASELFIENCDGITLSSTPVVIKCNKDSFTNNSNNKFVSAKYHAEELNNFKNKLLFTDEFSMKGLKPNSNSINNELAADLCDNLTEQVG